MGAPEPRAGEAWRRLAAFVLGVGLLQANLIQFWFKYAPGAPWPMALAAAVVPVAIMAALLFRPKILAAVRPRWLIEAMFFAAALATALVLYPQADALSTRGLGSDQDDCVRLVAGNLLAGRAPYHQAYSYLGNPCSTGLGEAVLYLPLAALRRVELGAVVLLAICWRWLETRAPRQGDLFLLLMGTSLTTWYQIAVGSDFIFIGLAALFVALLLEADRLGAWRIGLAALLCGLVASSRTAFVYLPAVYALGLLPGRPVQALAFGLAATLATAGLTLGPYWIAPGEFTPAHVLGKGLAILGADLPVAIGVCGLAGLAMFVLAWRGGRRHGRLILAVGLGAPMALMAAFEAPAGTLTTNYLAVAAPALCAWLAQLAVTPRPLAPSRAQSDPSATLRAQV